MKNQENNPDRIEGIKKDNPFTVPENYFSEFSGRISQKLVTAKPEKGRVLHFAANTWIAVAASLLIIIFTGVVGYQLIKPVQIINSEVPGNNIADLQAEDLHNFDEAMLMETLADQPQAETDPEDDAIINYLVDNNIENSEIVDTD